MGGASLLSLSIQEAQRSPLVALYLEAALSYPNESDSRHSDDAPYNNDEPYNNDVPYNNDAPHTTMTHHTIMKGNYSNWFSFTVNSHGEVQDCRYVMTHTDF